MVAAASASSDGRGISNGLAAVSGDSGCRDKSEKRNVGHDGSENHATGVNHSLTHSPWLPSVYPGCDAEEVPPRTRVFVLVRVVAVMVIMMVVMVMVVMVMVMVVIEAVIFFYNPCTNECWYHYLRQHSPQQS